MTTYTLGTLSGSTDGRAVKVAATSIGSGTTIHTAGAGLDMIELYAENENASGVTRTLTLGIGGTSSPDDIVTVSIPAKAGLVYLGKFALKNSLIIKAAADVANEVLIHGSKVTVS